MTFWPAPDSGDRNPEVSTRESGHAPDAIACAARIMPRLVATIFTGRRICAMYSMACAIFVPLSATERFTALQSGEVDVLWRNTSWTFTRDTDNRLDFAGINYFDGHGFLVRRSDRKSTRLNSSH